MPLQSDLLGQLFMGLSTDRPVIGSDLSVQGLVHSERLAQYLRDRFQLGEKELSSWLQHWPELQERYTLEGFYRELEASVADDSAWVLADFEAIVRTRISGAVDRSRTGACAKHSDLFRHLEPGDYIVDFNWDTIASDALYHNSRLWHPSTGFGLPIQFVISNDLQDQHPVDSALAVYHIHGCVDLYEVFIGERTHPSALGYRAPDGFDSTSSMIKHLRVSDHELRNATAEEDERFRVGWIKLSNGPWLRPIFVPPSTKKAQYSDRYNRLLRRAIQSRMPDTMQFVVFGYSVPEADQPHLASFFLRDVIAANDPTLWVVNTDGSPEYLERVRAAFPSTRAVRHFSAFDDFLKQSLTENPRHVSYNPATKT